LRPVSENSFENLELRLPHDGDGVWILTNPLQGIPGKNPQAKGLPARNLQQGTKKQQPASAALFCGEGEPHQQLHTPFAWKSEFRFNVQQPMYQRSWLFRSIICFPLQFLANPVQVSSKDLRNKSAENVE
jgi:hypothetical protein